MFGFICIALGSILAGKTMSTFTPKSLICLVMSVWTPLPTPMSNVIATTATMIPVLVSRERCQRSVRAAAAAPKFNQNLCTALFNESRPKIVP